MATRSPRLLRFRPDGSVELVRCIDELRAARNGWINFRPYVKEIDGDPDDVDGTNEYRRPRGSALGIGGYLLKPAPPTPECTWVPGEDHRRKGRLPDSLGLQHPSGNKAGPALVAAGATLPAGWRVIADNARRGLVLAIPTDADTAEAVHWLLRAAQIVTPFQLSPDWVAEVHTR